MSRIASATEGVRKQAVPEGQMIVYENGIQQYRNIDSMRKDISNGALRAYPVLDEGEDVTWTVDGRCIIMRVRLE